MAGSVAALIDAFAVHGGRIDRARAAFPMVSTWTDLSTGIAPWRYPVAPDPGAWAGLPDPSAVAALEALAANAFGADAARVTAVPGTDLALRLLGAILPGRAGWVAPGYSGHRIMWSVDRAIPLAQGDWSAASDHLDAIVLARPNNPDGWRADRASLAVAADRLSARGGYLIVDEAFADATPGDTVAGCDWPGLIVLRSFGKFFGLAGLRLGFVIAPPDVQQRLCALIGDWPLPAPALAAGCAAYADSRWQAEQRARLIAGSQRMRTVLAAHDMKICGQTPFFTLVDCSPRDALFVHLARHGVLTRPFGAHQGWLRLGLPDNEAGWTRLAQALAAWRTT